MAENLVSSLIKVPKTYSNSRN